MFGSYGEATLMKYSVDNGQHEGRMERSGMRVPLHAVVMRFPPVC